MTETTVHIQAANITGDGVEYFVNGNIESITISAVRAKKIFDELTALREENGRLREREAMCEKIELEAGVIIDNENSHVSMYYEAMRENAELRERLDALEALADSVGILCEEMYGAEHLQPFPVDMIPETAQQKMNAVLEASGYVNELGALLATAEGGEFAAGSQPLPDDILSDYSDQEKAEFCNDWRNELGEATE